MKYLIYEYGMDLKKMYILPFSDIHFGDPKCNIKKLKEYLTWVKDNDAKIILNGDIFNLADVSKIGADLDMISPNEQLDIAVNIFSPFKDNILGVVEGNHDRRMRKVCNFDMMHEFCQRIKISDKYDTVSIIIKISFGKDRRGKMVRYHIYATHGWGAGRTKGSKVNNMEQTALTYPVFDVYITSHSHFAVGYQDIIKIPRENRNGELIERKRTFVSSGCFVGHSNYAEIGGRPAVKQGTIRIRLDGTRRDVHFSL